jgi:hypothetical protein
MTVCSKCIFDEHNGHSLTQIEEMASELKANVIALQKLILTTKGSNEEGFKLLE